MASVLILAGSRAEACPLCMDANVASKALVPLHGERMIDHMLRSLRDTPALDGDIWITGLCPNQLRKNAPADLIDFIDRIKPTAIGDDPASATLAAIKAGATTPLLLTTCDHPLLTPSMVNCLLEGAERETCDFAVGLATRTVIRQAYPETQRTYLPLGGEGYSGCNLFLVRTELGRSAIEFWQQVGKDRKKPWKLAKHLSFSTLLRMLTGQLDLQRVFALGSSRLQAKICPIIIPIAEAAIDVDKPADLTLVSTILAEAS